MRYKIGMFILWWLWWVVICASYLYSVWQSEKDPFLLHFASSDLSSYWGLTFLIIILFTFSTLSYRTSKATKCIHTSYIVFHRFFLQKILNNVVVITSLHLLNNEWMLMYYCCIDTFFHAILTWLLCAIKHGSV